MKLFERFFTNHNDISPSSVGLYPPTAKEFMNISIWSDPVSYGHVVDVYADGFGPNASEHVQNLKGIAEKFAFQYWNELLAFFLGSVVAILDRPITALEAKVLPCVATRFFYNQALGICRIPGLGMTFIRVQPFQRCSVIPVFFPISSSINLKQAEQNIKKFGWQSETIPGKKLYTPAWEPLRCGYLGQNNEDSYG